MFSALSLDGFLRQRHRMDRSQNSAKPGTRARHHPRFPSCCLILFVTLRIAAGQRPLDAPVLQAAETAAAQQAFHDKHYREAAEMFAKIAEAATGHDPAASGRARLMQAKCLVNLNAWAGAEAALRASLETEGRQAEGRQTQPRSAEALYLLGFVLQRENEPAASLRIYTQAAAITPPLPNDLKLVALDYVLLNDYPDALHWLARAVAADPQNAEGWYDLGRAQMHQGHFEEAVNAFRRNLSLQPKSAKAWDNLGLSLEAQNKPDAALKAYANAVESNSTAAKPSERPLLDDAALLNNHREYAQAIPLLLRATELAPGSSRCFEELARAYTGQEQPKLAQAALAQAVALDPKNPRLHFQLGRLDRSLGLLAEAKAEFERSAALYGTHSVTTEE